MKKPEPLLQSWVRRSGRDYSWGVLFLSFALIFVACDTASRLAFLKAATAVRTSDATSGSRAMATGAHERWSVLPAASLDSRWWVIHAEESLRTGVWRIRATTLDNAPKGREVHWSSALIWYLDAVAWVRSLFTGDQAIHEVQYAARWAGPLLLVFGLVAIATLVRVRFGWAFAGFQTMVLASSFPVVEMFRAGEADHHGLVLLFALCSVICLVFGGAGFSLPYERGKKWFALSGCFGAAGLWVSAASMIPVLCACALGAVLATATRTKGNSPVRSGNQLWRAWGVCGSACSLAFYMLEYFPSHLGWRLEVNHPIYAIAWLGGGELLARLCARFSEKPSAFTLKDVAVCIVAGVCMAGPAGVIFLRSAEVFWVADPFLLALHKEHIREFAPLISTVLAERDWSSFLDHLFWPLFVIAGILALSWWTKIEEQWRGFLVFTVTVAAGMQALALLQVRWSGLAIAMWSVCVMQLWTIHFRKQFIGAIPRTVVAAMAALAVLGLLLFPQLSLRTFLAGDPAANLPKGIAPTILLRDIAHRLIQSSPDHLPVVLSDPTSSTDLAYYGGIQTVGTLYWENLPGLRTTAELLAAPTEAEARQRLQAAHVTHVVMPSWDAFASPSASIRLLQQVGALSAAQTDSYLGRVITGTECPTWLRPYYYPIPPAFGLAEHWVRVFEVRYNQTAFEAFRYQGVFYAESGNFGAAMDRFHKALKEDPADLEVKRWLAVVSKAANRQGTIEDPALPASR